MVEEITASMEATDLEGLNMEDMKRLLNDPRYLNSAEAEIDKMMENAKIALTELGLDLDRERLVHIEEEKKEEVEETELQRLLEGGLPFCRKPKDCGHLCAGVSKEQECLPCLEADCISGTNLPFSEELCNICYTCELREEPSVQLGCGHIFHANCIVELLKHKWATLRITFSFMSCPGCKAAIEVDHVDEIYDELEKLTVLRSELQVKAMKIAKNQGLDRNERVLTPGDFFFNNLMGFAESKVCFYMCSKCIKPYFGGLIDCEQEMVMEDNTRREDLICRPCLMKEMSIGSNICNKGHGAEAIDWKCMFCCSVALFFCGTGLWFCDRCHNEAKGNQKIRDCKGKGKCPLNVPHPPAGRDPKKSAFPLGCSLCRSEHLEEYDAAQAEIRALIDEGGVSVFADFDRTLHSSQAVNYRGKGKKGGKKGKKRPLAAVNRQKQEDAARRRQELERRQMKELNTAKRAKDR